MSLTTNDLVFYRDKNSGNAYSCGYKLNSEFLADNITPIRTRNTGNDNDTDSVRALYSGAIVVPIGFLNTTSEESPYKSYSESSQVECIPPSLFESLLALSSEGPHRNQNRTRKHRNLGNRNRRTRCHRR